MTDTLLRQLEDLRDLARTGLKPDLYPTELSWLRGKCDRLAYEADKAIETAKMAERVGRELCEIIEADMCERPDCQRCGTKRPVLPPPPAWAGRTRSRSSMGKTTRISWTDHTFNPWIGCTKVSPGCANCYAERENKHFHWNPAGWGPDAPRTRTSESNWKQPIAWNRKAERDGVRRRVFCASLADVFDDHPSIDRYWRNDLCRLIEQCRNLDWLILTKRPKNVKHMIVAATGRDAEAWLADCKHVWIGVTAENQEQANKRIPMLRYVPAAVKFVSVEPMLGPVDMAQAGDDICLEWFEKSGVNWVICGCESGPSRRPMELDWVRKLRDQCVAAGVPYFLKQADIGGKVVKEPELDGRKWLQVPEVEA